jgi:polysaccharide export outer membrane protein
MRRTLLALMIVLTGLLGGCATPHYRSALFDAHANEPYTLGSGDRLRIIVFGQDSLSNTYSVDGSGHISMPLIGLVEAAGLTTSALARDIENRLHNGFLREPQVSVEVEAYRPFFVLGEVTTAGQYPFINGMTVENAVAIAGGFSPRADKSGADLTRVINGVPVTATVPLVQPMRPGDTVTIRERFF